MHSRLPFVFIHGAGGTQSKWRLVRERLTEGEGLYPDLPGHGLNTEPAKESIEEYARAISKQIQQDVIVVGHSMGGLVGIELAAMNTHVKALVLAASHYRLPVHEKILLRLRDGAFPNSLFYASYSKDAKEELIEEELGEISLVSTETTALDYECCNRYETGKETLLRLDVPVFALYGTEDKLLPPGAKDELIDTSHHVEIENIFHAAHYVMLEQPDEFVSDLRQIQRSLL